MNTKNGTIKIPDIRINIYIVYIYIFTSTRRARNKETDPFRERKHALHRAVCRYNPHNHACIFHTLLNCNFTLVTVLQLREVSEIIWLRNLSNSLRLEELWESEGISVPICFMMKNWIGRTAKTMLSDCQKFKQGVLCWRKQAKRPTLNILSRK